MVLPAAGGRHRDARQRGALSPRHVTRLGTRCAGRADGWVTVGRRRRRGAGGGARTGRLGRRRARGRGRRWQAPARVPTAPSGTASWRSPSPRPLPLPPRAPPTAPAT
eukprot:2151891-Rhodomonas_salina.1